MNGLRRRLMAVAFGVMIMSLAVVGVTEGQGVVEQFDGTLLIVWGDPNPAFGSGGEMRYSLALPDGRVFPLQAAGQANLSAFDSGTRVTVTGRRVADLSASAGPQSPEAIVVDTIALSQLRTDASGAPALVSGTRSVIYLLVKFSDDVAVPHVPVFYTDLNNPLTPPGTQVFPTTVNGFFAKTSWSQFSWVGDVGGVGGVGASGGWLTLPNPKSYYAPCGWSTSCANLSALSADAVTLAKAQGIVFTPYDNINFVLSNDLDCCAWGGGYSLDGKSYGATWEPPWGQEAGTYAHEMGHSLGLPHSGWVYYAYDSPWDMMSSRRSASSAVCGSYVSVNNAATNNLSCTEPGDGYITPHKDFLGWIPPANLVVTDTLTSGSWAIEGGALPLSAALKLVKVCLPGLPCSGNTAHYLTIEARVKALGATSQFDNAIPNEGVIIHDVLRGRPAISGSCYFNNQSGWAVPIDATPGDYNSSTCTYAAGTALLNAQWLPGQTYTNNTYAVSISVLSRSGSTFVVSVTPTAPGTFGKTAAANGATGQSTSLTLGWGAAGGATGYEYCIDTTNDNACSVWTSTGANTSIALSGLSTNTTYYWQVRANNATGTTYANGSTTAFWNFGTNLVANGDFGAGAAGWATFGAPDSTYMTSQIVSGVYQWRRTPQAGGQPVSQATVYQPTGVALGAGVPVAATFNIGNTSSARKYMKVLLVGDANFTDLAACTFWLAPNAPLTTYQMRAHTTKAWTNATIYFYASSSNTDNGYYLLDNVSMTYGGAQAVNRTDCVDPTVPAPPGGAAGATLLTNGDFNTGTLAPWGTVGTLTTQIASSGGDTNVLEFYRGAAFPPPVVAQATAQAMTANQLLTTTFQLGNSSPVRKRVLILLNDSDFSDLTACTFWLEPGAALATYSMTGFASKAWTNAQVSLYPSTQYDSGTPANNPWIRVENVTLQRTPSAVTTGTTCLEP